MSSKNLKWIEKIINITKHIDTLYTELYQLEINNKKDTVEYKEILDNLNSFIKLEEKTYKSINITSFICEEFTIYILMNYLDPSFFSKYYRKDIETIMNQDYSNRIYIRILNQMHNNITNLNNKSNIDNQISQIYNRDLLALYLFFLEEIKNIEPLSMFKESFINQKYNISFINKAIESEMFYNNFIIPDTYYSIIHLFKDKNIETDKYKEMIKRQIDEIMKLSNMDYNNDISTISSIFRQCLIRSILLTMNDEDINDIESYFNKTAQDSINNRSKDFIDNCFKSISSDKSKINVLSFKPIK